MLIPSYDLNLLLVVSNNSQIFLNELHRFTLLSTKHRAVRLQSLANSFPLKLFFGLAFLPLLCH